MLMKNEKVIYEAPTSSILEMRYEGVICASGSELVPNDPFSGNFEDNWII